jgi:hypothetical protein
MAQIWDGAYQSLIEMEKLQGEVTGGRQVQEHAHNKKKTLDRIGAVWTVQL